jgi:hypothetical protein
MMKKLVLAIAVVFVLGGAVQTAKLFGYPEVANLLDAQIAAFSAQYHAAKAEKAALESAEVAAQISTTTVE